MLVVRGDNNNNNSVSSSISSEGSGGSSNKENKKQRSTSEIAVTTNTTSSNGKKNSNNSKRILSSSTARKNDETLDKWSKLQNLKNLLNAGFLTKQEYKERKSQLVDELTGTVSLRKNSGNSSSGGGGGGDEHLSNSKTKIQRIPRHLPVVVPRLPPNFDSIESEEAVKWMYDIEKRQWKSQRIELKLDPTPFSRGALRYVYHLKQVRILRDNTTSNDNDDDDNNMNDESMRRNHDTTNTAITSSVTYVAKISIDPRDQQDRAPYFRDVEMQSLAKYYATRFNSYNPPKGIDFVKAWIVELIQREGQPICGVERFIEGPYRKHNNNYGYVNEEERSTPQAFSHFTWEASSHNVLICDIQGVGDMYTDPQIHSLDGVGFGKGNMGEKGIERFLSSHRCNAVCRYLKLPPINANYGADGTLPTGTYMSYQQISAVDINNQLTDQTPLLPPKKNTKKTSSSNSSMSNGDSMCWSCAIL